jgi:hypothetical protein
VSVTIRRRPQAARQLTPAALAPALRTPRSSRAKGNGDVAGTVV